MDQYYYKHKNSNNTMDSPPSLKQQKTAGNIEELFQRINKGGTPLANVDQQYSALCAYSGNKVKNATMNCPKISSLRNGLRSWQPD